jgi:hypothetical protein
VIEAVSHSRHSPILTAKALAIKAAAEEEALVEEEVLVEEEELAGVEAVEVGRRGCFECGDAYSFLYTDSSDGHAYCVRCFEGEMVLMYFTVLHS